MGDGEIRDPDDTRPVRNGWKESETGKKNEVGTQKKTIDDKRRRKNNLWGKKEKENKE